MGLLPDYLFDNSTYDGGGLMPWLTTTVANLQQGGSPMLTGQPYGRFPMQPDAPSGSVMQPPALAQVDAPPARQTGGAMPSALGNLPLPSLPSLAGAGAGSPSLGDRLGAGLMGFAQSEAPLPALGNLISGLITGKRSDPTGVALERQQQAQKAAAQYINQSTDIEPAMKGALLASPELATQFLQSRIKGSGTSSDIAEHEYAKRQGCSGSLADWIARKRAGAGEYGLQPVYGVDAQGKPVGKRWSFGPIAGRVPAMGGVPTGSMVPGGGQMIGGGAADPLGVR